MLIKINLQGGPVEASQVFGLKIPVPSIIRCSPALQQ